MLKIICLVALFAVLNVKLTSAAQRNVQHRSRNYQHSEKNEHHSPSFRHSGYKYSSPSTEKMTTTTTTTTTPKPTNPPSGYLPPKKPVPTYLPPTETTENPEEPEKHEHHEEHQPGMPFDFSYEVKDAETANDYSHQASSDGDVTRGEYRVQLPDGRIQVVKYTADWKNGYNAIVSYE